MTAMIKTDRQALSGGLPLHNTQVVFQQTLPRHLVHRAAVSEVFLTSLVDNGDGAFHLGAQWPRFHQFFGPRAQLHDPILLAETIRQAALAIAHRYYEVPLTSQFLMTEISYDICEEGLRLAGSPADVVLTAVPRGIRKHGDKVVGMSIDVGCYRDGYLVGTGSAAWRCVSPAIYARLRGEHRDAVPLPLPPPVWPHLVGRYLTTDVVLSPCDEENRWLVRVDTSHPVMFDHKLDHVPGMMAVEAARQAALLVAGTAEGVPVAARFFFDRFIELDAPCHVSVVAKPAVLGTGRVPIEVKLEQGGHFTVVGELDLLVRRR